MIKGSASAKLGEYRLYPKGREYPLGCYPCCAARGPDIDAAAVELLKVRDVSACENVKVVCVEPRNVSQALLGHPSGSCRETAEAVHLDYGHVNARSMQKVMKSLAGSKSLYQRYAQLVSSEEINEVRSQRVGSLRSAEQNWDTL
jgi:hypothetical protein